MKKKCHVLDCTGESLPVFNLPELMHENVGCLYLFGTWEKMRQVCAALSEQHAQRGKLRVVAVTYGQPCGDIPYVDRWFCLSREVMTPACARKFINHLQQCFNCEALP